MILGEDLDGCVFDFTENWLSYLDETNYWEPRGLESPEDRKFHKWNDYERMGIDLREFLRTCEEGVDAGYIFRIGEPIPGSRETLARLRDEGHKIHIITHRTFGQKSIRNTEEWLKEQEIEFDAITFAEDKTVVRVDLLLDDRDVNYEASVKAGIPAVLLTRDWNRHVENALRVADWDEYYSLVQAFDLELRWNRSGTLV